MDFIKKLQSNSKPDKLTKRPATIEDIDEIKIGSKRKKKSRLEPKLPVSDSNNEVIKLKFRT